MLLLAVQEWVLAPVQVPAQPRVAVAVVQPAAAPDRLVQPLLRK